MSGLSSDSVTPVSGYVEGYYGRLLSWDDRTRILEVLADQGFNCYFYGPKDDTKHRIAWRNAYGADWRQAFRRFTQRAEQLGISVIAGIAPGLDFDFAAMNPEHGDLALLCSKSRQLLDDGAAAIGLMMDDIDNDFHKRRGNFSSEGEAHAILANHLLALAGNQNPTQELPAVFCVPRIYANELLAHNDLTMPAMSEQESEKPGSEVAESADYMPSFTSSLDPNVSWIYCGKHVVSSQPEVSHCREIGAGMKHRIVIWDNYYANDYCPRRLFLGAWQGRNKCSELLLNGTGLPHTDCLLLRIVAALRSVNQSADLSEIEAASSVNDTWRNCLIEAGVPDDFFQLQSYFNHPVFSDASLDEAGTGDTANSTNTVEQQIAAIDSLLWRWKAALAREWYPYLFGLKQDLQMASGTMPELRVRKTQTPALADYITKRRRPTEH